MPLKRGAGPVASVNEVLYWKAVFPSFDEREKQVPEHALACTGWPVLSAPLLRGGESRRGWPLAVEEGDAVVGAGANRMRAVWLRTHSFHDGTEGGPLALVRGTPGFVEVYAVGVLRGIARLTRLEVRRMGSDVAVLAFRDECRERIAGKPCRTRAQVLLPRGGTMAVVAEFDSERVAYGVSSEPGVRGDVEYRLTTTIELVGDGLKLVEQVVVRDAQGTEVRRAELGRTFLFAADTRLEADDDPLWPRVYRRVPPNG